MQSCNAQVLYIFTYTKSNFNFEVLEIFLQHRVTIMTDNWLVVIAKLSVSLESFFSLSVT